jgi:methylmalonyl-CoA mutase
LELAYTLADGWEYIRAGLRAGLRVDEFVPRFSFFWGIGMDFITEIAKLRAGRYLWAKIVSQYNPSNPKAMALRTHCQTSGYSLTAQAPYNNIARTTIEAMAAVLGGTQSLHTNSLDEAIALPTDYSAKIARNTQLYLQNRTDLTKAIDPLGGSHLIEKRTTELIREAWNLICEIEELGGMTKALEKGIPKLRIEEAAAAKQARIDSGQDKIIGVNSFIPEKEEDINTLEVDNEKVRNDQIQKINLIKAERNSQNVQHSLDLVRKAAKKGKGILEAAVEAARARATLGEISMAMEEIWGRYQARHQTISGVYAKAVDMDENFKKAAQLADEFASQEGRRPRIMIAKLGQDGHDRGAKVIASSFADLGWDVDIGPLFQTPEEAARHAAENDVHILGISSLAAGHKSLVPETIAALKKIGREDILVIVGGVIPPKDYDFLFKKGVAAVFGPGTVISKAAIALLDILLDSAEST